MRKLWSTFNLPTKISAAWVSIILFFVVTGSFLPLPNPTEYDPEASGVGLFSSGHLLGTDINGYDLLSNVINGARISILIALISVGVGGLIGSAIGIGSAYVRGKLDIAVNLLFNILLSIPNLVLGLALVAILATSPDPSIPIDPNRRVFIIIFSLTVIIIPILGRIARGATLSWVNREFIVAARSMGMKDRHIIFKHIVPNVLPAIYAVIFLAIGVVIVAEGALSLLGVGIIDGVSWGAITHRGQLEAVRGVDLDIQAGTSIGIVGESGSGKTVMSRAAMGLLTGSNVTRDGRITFDGKVLSDMSREEVRNEFGTGMAMIFQDPMTALNPVRRIGSQLQESLRVRLGMSRKEARARSIELLTLVRIPEPKQMLRKFPSQLSGGMRQRIMIAIAISCNPKLLFADEPTTALDVTVQAQILELLTDLRQRLNMTMVLVTHDLGVVAGNTDYVAVMYAGEIVEQAPTTELFANMKMPYTEALFKSIPNIQMKAGSRLPVIEGRLPDPTDRPPGCGFAARCSYAQDKCFTEHPELEAAKDGHLYRCWFPLGDSIQRKVS